MKTLNLLIASLLILAMSFACSANDAKEQIKSLQNAQESASKDSGKIMPSSSQGNPLPAMNFYSSFAKDTIYVAIKANSRFSKLDKELVGSPITLRVTHSVRPTSGGQAVGFLSAIISGTSLGLIPMPIAIVAAGQCVGWIHHAVEDQDARAFGTMGSRQ